MPPQHVDPEQAKLKRQQRNQRYRANLETTERNKEKNKLYQQIKRQQTRLRQHQDPLAQLADIITQQEYLEQIAPIDEGILDSVSGEEEAVDVSGIVEENGEVLENFDYGQWDIGLNDDDGEWNGGFNDEVDLDMSDDGNQPVINY